MTGKGTEHDGESVLTNFGAAGRDFSTLSLREVRPRLPTGLNWFTPNPDAPLSPTVYPYTRAIDVDPVSRTKDTTRRCVQLHADDEHGPHRVSNPDTVSVLIFRWPRFSLRRGRGPLCGETPGVIGERRS